MARLINQLHKNRLQASTLIEVIIAMTILLTVFAVGMMIYANLSKSQSSQQSKAIQFQMDNLLKQYPTSEQSEQEIAIDSILYIIQTDPVPNISDRIKIKIYAQSLSNGQFLDSLIGITENTSLEDRNESNY